MLLPGEVGAGLSASIELGPDFIRLFAGDDDLGTWRQRDCEVTPDGNGSYVMVLDGEQVTFTPTSPLAFAEAVPVSLQSETVLREGDELEGTTYDLDAAIDDVVAQVRHLNDTDDEILSKPMLVGIVTVATVLIAGLVALSLTI